MKNFIAIAIFLFSVSLNCFSQCEELDSFRIDNLLSDRKKIEERKKKKPETKKKESRNTNSVGGFTVSGASENNFSFYPTELMTWGIGFSEGLAKITVNGKSGFINQMGKIVIRPQYVLASCFSEGLAAIEIKDKWGFINQKGELIIPPKFDAAANFSEGLALVKVGKLWGYINRNGSFEIEPAYEEAGSFSEGFAVIGFYDKDYVWTSHERTNGKWRRNFIDKHGKLKFSQNFDGISRNFNSGMALVDRQVGYKNGVLSESYFIDKEGQELWKLNSWYITWFSNDLIVVAVDRDKETKRDKYSFLNRNGQRVTEKVYDYLSEFSEGTAVASINSKSGFIDKNGEFIIKPKYDSANGFSEGLAAVWEDEKSGFIDVLENWKIKLKFDWTDGFKEGRSAIAIGEKIAYIDKTGKYIWKPTK